jgi:hypothetical protein
MHLCVFAHALQSPVLIEQAAHAPEFAELVEAAGFLGGGHAAASFLIAISPLARMNSAAWCGLMALP